MRVLICLSASDNWYGRAIRKLTGSVVNHAFLAYTSEEWGGWWAVQIDERGVVKIPAERVELDYVECYEFDSVDFGESLRESRYMYGERYDWFGIVGFLVKLIVWRLFRKVVFNPLHRKGQLFCSEFVASVLRVTRGVCPEIRALTPSSVAPGGDPERLGTPSLRWELRRRNGIKEVPCPWR